MNIEEVLPQAREALAQRYSMRVLELLSALEPVDQNDPRVLALRASAFLFLGRTNDGLKNAQHALHRTSDARLAVELGRALWPYDSFCEAGFCFAKAVRLKPAWPRARNLLARALHGVGADENTARAIAAAAGLSPEEGAALAQRHARVLLRLQAARLDRRRRGAATTRDEAVARGVAAVRAERSGVLCEIRRGGRLFRISWTHPRDMYPGPYRGWQQFRCKMTQGDSDHWAEFEPGKPAEAMDSVAGRAESITRLIDRIFAWRKS